jgi:hypothetical protein
MNHIKSKLTRASFVVAGITILAFLVYITYYVFPCAKRLCNRIEGRGESESYLPVSDKVEKQHRIEKRKKRNELVLDDKDDSSIL